MIVKTVAVGQSPLYFPQECQIIYHIYNGHAHHIQKLVVFFLITIYHIQIKILIKGLHFQAWGLLIRFVKF